MAVVRPFKGVRPKDQKMAEEMISLPYDVMNKKEAKEMAKGKRHSFLRIVRSEIELPEFIDIYSKEVYLKAKNILDKWRQEGILITDKKPYFYIYRQKMEHRVQTGLVACASIDDYMNNVIKKHELTRKEKELDRINHFDICDANTEPVFFTYRKKEEISKIINDWTESHTDTYNITTEDKITHIVWVLDDEVLINKLIELFASIDCLYIADGHHRSASAVATGINRRKDNPNYTGKEKFNHFLTVIFPDEDLYIMDYNRAVKDLNGLSSKEFLNKVGEKFTIFESKIAPFKPGKKNEFGMFLDKKWYVMSAKPDTYFKQDPVESLDVAILQNNLLGPILGIEDPRTNNRIDFIGGIRGLKELEKRVNKDMKVAFSLFPVTIKELMAVSDANRIMPPKCTWFEPKLRSGLFIHTLS